MDKKKSVPQPSSSSGESSSSEEEEIEQGFVRSDRELEKIEDKKAQKSDDESESEEGNEDEDDDDDEIDGTQRAKANQASSSEDKQPSHGEGESDSDSETSSTSHGKSTKPSHHFVVLPRKAENGNVHTGKKAPTSEKLLKSNVMSESSPKKGKEKVFKRDREVESAPEKGSSKKQKKGRADVAGESVEHVPKAKDSEKESKDKSVQSNAAEKKNGSKKSAHATAEKPERASTLQNSAKKPESASANKAAKKGKNDKKNAKNADVEAAKGSLSPTKPKLFTGKDEIVLTSEILHDIRKGIEIPSKKSDEYWTELADRVEKRMEGSWSKEQLNDKFKRMKTRYGSMVEKFRDNGEHKFRNAVDQELFAMWDQIWGNGDATKVDDSGDAKNKQTKVSAAGSPVKGVKALHDKVAALVQDVKVAAEESEGHKSIGDLSESEESDGGGDSPKKELIVTPMEINSKDAHADGILVPENITDTALSHSVSEAQKLFNKEIRATLSEIQESSRQTLKEWQHKALAVVENAVVKAVANQARIMSGFGMGVFDELASPLRSLDMRDLQLSEGDHALQQQWHELRLKELDVYCQRLELMQRECQLKQDQMKALAHKNK